MHKVLFTMTAMAMCVAACGDDSANNDGSGGAGAGAGGSSSSSSGTGGSDATAERTLDSCTTTVGEGVPDFFKTYFKCSDISVDGDNVVIVTKNLPPHKSAYYGEDSANYEAFDTSRGSQYRQNPNAVVEQNVTLQFPINPTPKTGLVIDDTVVNGSIDGRNTDEYPMGSGGVAINSVILFNPLAGPGDDIEDEKYTFDIYNGHPQQQGNYHYHTNSMGPLEVLLKLGLVTTTTPEEAEIELYGVMCDGTVVMGCTELDGSAPDTTGLDAQNGHAHDIKAKDNAVLLPGRYHTHICPKWTDATHKFTPEIQYYDACAVTRSR